MKRAAVIIGANYGDEGKGLVTDYITHGLSGPKVVVRFNGGAQAGHTVVTPDGTRHVFSHFGSGTFAGAGTYLAKHYVCNPLLFWKEVNKLSLRDTSHDVAADPRCYITTPYDMLVNQTVEEKRGKNRHGSVGVGFGETIERCQYPSFRICKSDLADGDLVRKKLKTIRDVWLPTRCRQLRIPELMERSEQLHDSLFDKIIESFTAFDKVVITAGAEFLDGKSVVFEGAQGLALDMNGPNFPHVTRSNTGLTNVLPIAKVMNLSLDVLYVTRTYLTKHGAGPLPGECEPWTVAMEDSTNTHHPYQGPLRYASLDTADMRLRITEDRKLLPTGGTVGLVVTCLDQVPNDDLTRLKSVKYTSTGPTRSDVRNTGQLARS